MVQLLSTVRPKVQSSQISIALWSTLVLSANDLTQIRSLLCLSLIRLSIKDLLQFLVSFIDSNLVTWRQHNGMTAELSLIVVLHAVRGSVFRFLHLSFWHSAIKCVIYYHVT